jgi:hypothetical protein
MNVGLPASTPFRVNQGSREAVRSLVGGATKEGLDLGPPTQ